MVWSRKCEIAMIESISILVADVQFWIAICAFLLRSRRGSSLNRGAPYAIVPGEIEAVPQAGRNHRRYPPTEAGHLSSGSERAA